MMKTTLKTTLGIFVLSAFVLTSSACAEGTLDVKADSSKAPQYPCLFLMT
ncbi:MAG: hypothetical protein LBT89_04105 [Planctomycetaceae bacterium]|jgi:hypothetical protein|nr:hypothetical protein [Planctomycetaceae bacterium]